MTRAGAVRMYKDGEVQPERYEKAMEARKLFMAFWEADCPRIAIENPTPMLLVNLPKPSQIIQPYDFGHPYSKRTCLWLKGLPPLMATSIYMEYQPFVNGGCKDKKGRPRKAQGGAERDGKSRSKTFQGIAQAMAEQWGDL